MIQTLIHLYYKLVPTYKVVETKRIGWDEADKLLKENDGKPESEQWCLAKEEDGHKVDFTVYLCRKIRLK